MPGLTNYSLATIIPTSSQTWAGFFTVAPDDDGTGGTEATGSGYARAAVSSWVTTEVSGVRYRETGADVAFAALTADLDDIVAWGVWDAVSGGNLLAWGPLLDVSGNEVTQTFTSGNQPRFSTGELKIGIED